MQVYLRKKKLSDGRQSLYLDIYKDGQRKYEFLQLYIKRGDANNKETLSFGQQIRDARYKELINDEYGFISSQKKKASFIKYFESFVETKPKWSNYHGALKHLKNYASQEDILFKQINKAWLNDIAEYLSKKAGLKKNTSFIYFRKIKEVIYNASQKGFIKADIARQVKNLPKEIAERGCLELAEIQKLAITPCDRPEIKRAFLFSCFTGLRQSDVRNLTWKNIQDNKIKIKQQKTKGDIDNTLSQTALNILKLDNILPLPDTKIFNVPNDRIDNKQSFNKMV